MSQSGGLLDQHTRRCEQSQMLDAILLMSGVGQPIHSGRHRKNTLTKHSSTNIEGLHWQQEALH